MESFSFTHSRIDAMRLPAEQLAHAGNIICIHTVAESVVILGSRGLLIVHACSHEIMSSTTFPSATEILSFSFAEPAGRLAVVLSNCSLMLLETSRGRCLYMADLSTEYGMISSCQSGNCSRISIDLSSDGRLIALAGLRIEEASATKAAGRYHIRILNVADTGSLCTAQREVIEPSSLKLACSTLPRIRVFWAHLADELTICAVGKYETELMVLANKDAADFDVTFPKQINFDPKRREQYLTDAYTFIPVAWKVFPYELGVFGYDSDSRYLITHLDRRAMFSASSSSTSIQSVSNKAINFGNHTIYLETAEDVSWNPSSYMQAEVDIEHFKNLYGIPPDTPFDNMHSFSYTAQRYPSAILLFEPWVLKEPHEVVPLASGSVSLSEAPRSIHPFGHNAIVVIYSSILQLYSSSSFVWRLALEASLPADNALSFSGTFLRCSMLTSNLPRIDLVHVVESVIVSASLSLEKILRPATSGTPYLCRLQDGMVAAVAIAEGSVPPPAYNCSFIPPKGTFLVECVACTDIVYVLTSSEILILRIRKADSRAPDSIVYEPIAGDTSYAEQEKLIAADRVISRVEYQNKMTHFQRRQTLQEAREGPVHEAEILDFEDLLQADTHADTDPNIHEASPNGFSQADNQEVSTNDFIDDENKPAYNIHSTEELILDPFRSDYLTRYVATHSLHQVGVVSILDVLGAEERLGIPLKIVQVTPSSVILLLLCLDSCSIYHYTLLHLSFSLSYDSASILTSSHHRLYTKAVAKLDVLYTLDNILIPLDNCAAMVSLNTSSSVTISDFQSPYLQGLKFFCEGLLATIGCATYFLGRRLDSLHISKWTGESLSSMPGFLELQCDKLGRSKQFDPCSFVAVSACSSDSHVCIVTADGLLLAYNIEKLRVSGPSVVRPSYSCFIQTGSRVTFLSDACDIHLCTSQGYLELRSPSALKLELIAAKLSLISDMALADADISEALSEVHSIFEALYRGRFSLSYAMEKVLRMRNRCTSADISTHARFLMQCIFAINHDLAQRVLETVTSPFEVSTEIERSTCGSIEFEYTFWRAAGELAISMLDTSCTNTVVEFAKPLVRIMELCGHNICFYHYGSSLIEREVLVNEIYALMVCKIRATGPDASTLLHVLSALAIALKSYNAEFEGLVCKIEYASKDSPFSAMVAASFGLSVEFISTSLGGLAQPSSASDNAVLDSVRAMISCIHLSNFNIYLCEEGILKLHSRASAAENNACILFQSFARLLAEMVSYLFGRLQTFDAKVSSTIDYLTANENWLADSLPDITGDALRDCLGACIRMSKSILIEAGTTCLADLHTLSPATLWEICNVAEQLFCLSTGLSLLHEDNTSICGLMDVVLIALKDILTEVSVTEIDDLSEFSAHCVLPPSKPCIPLSASDYKRYACALILLMTNAAYVIADNSTLTDLSAKAAFLDSPFAILKQTYPILQSFRRCCEDSLDIQKNSCAATVLFELDHFESYVKVLATVLSSSTVSMPLLEKVSSDCFSRVANLSECFLTTDARHKEVVSLVALLESRMKSTAPSAKLSKGPRYNKLVDEEKSLTASLVSLEDKYKATFVSFGVLGRLISAFLSVRKKKQP